MGLKRNTSVGSISCDLHTDVFQQALGFYYQPEFYLLDPNGIVLIKWVGFTTDVEFEPVFLQYAQLGWLLCTMNGLTNFRQPVAVHALRVFDIPNSDSLGKVGFHRDDAKRGHADHETFPGVRILKIEHRVTSSVEEEVAIFRSSAAR